MKHLLKSIESHHLDLSHANVDITQLLTQVRDSRDATSSEGFYDALEKILAELRSTEHAHPFLKPVRRNEAPGYDIVIKHPMDLGTMAKKVKSHSYKTRREFVDDLNLIWDNCLAYNSDLSHPLRRSTVFMRKKADQAVERILGTAERVPPMTISVNGTSHGALPSPTHTPETNGRDSRHTPDTSPKMKMKLKTPKIPNGIPTPIPEERAQLPNGTVSPTRRGNPPPIHSSNKQHFFKPSRSLSALLDDPAIIRTPRSMHQYRELDLDMQRYLDSAGAGPSKTSPSGLIDPRNGFIPHDGTQHLRKKLSNVVRGQDQDNGFIGREFQTILGAGNIHDKSRDRSAYSDGEEISNRPRKRPRFDTLHSPESLTPHILEDGELLGSWWGAVGSNFLLGNGIPPLPQPHRSPSIAASTSKAKTMKKSHDDPSTTKLRKPGGLKAAMYKNVDTLRRIRRTHAVLMASNATQSGANPESTTRPAPALRLPDAPPAAPPDSAPLTIPLEGGSAIASHALKFNCALLLEHAGFESSSKVALDVLNDVAAEFIMNVGRTMQFLSNQHSDKMSSEEIILHALFESGITEVQHLERYIKDDVERYGIKLSELERKLDTAYKEQIEAEADAEEDGELFAEDGDALVMGDFSSFIGDDFFGLRELGLDKELGLASLSIPSKLFHGHAKKKDLRGAEGTASKDPLLRFPPPPPFVTLTSRKLDSQIGLLQPFYRGRFEHMQDTTTTVAPPPPPQSSPLATLPGVGSQVIPLRTTLNDPSTPPMSLPDDPPNLLKTKMGPLGQVSLAVAPGTKKKAKALPKQDGAGPVLGLGSAPVSSNGATIKLNAGTSATPPTKKKKPKKDQGMIPPPALPPQPSVMVS